mmetsp:Transcript_22648/g.42537  ORF Transcript_22648/g.42537 Transcript_22648/m.42537 type:complete len:240 (-) Transcript_22648:785-1504(-)
MGACSSGDSSPMLSVSIHHRGSASKLNPRPSKSAEAAAKTTIVTIPNERLSRDSATTLRLEDSYSPMDPRRRSLSPQVSPATMLMTPCRPSSRRGIKVRPREGFRFYIEDKKGLRCSSNNSNRPPHSRSSSFNNPIHNPRTILSMLRTSREEQERHSSDGRESGFSSHGFEPSSIHSARGFSISSRSHQLIRSTSIVSTTDNSVGSVLSIVGLERTDSPETKKALARNLPDLTELPESH